MVLNVELALVAVAFDAYLITLVLSSTLIPLVLITTIIVILIPFKKRLF